MDVTNTEDLTNPLACIVCNKKPEPVFGDEEECNNHQPYAATIFHTKGHYGSTFFDPMDRSVLEIVVCDDCLEVAKAQSKMSINKGN